MRSQGGVEALEIAVEAGDAQHVQRQGEEAVALLLGLFQLGDVPADAHQTSDHAIVTGQGHLGKRHPTAVAGSIGQGLLAIEQGLARLEHASIVGMMAGGSVGGKEIGNGLADDFLLGGRPQHALMGDVIDGVTSFRVGDENGIGQVVHEAAE